MPPAKWLLSFLSVGAAVVVAAIAVLDYVNDRSGNATEPQVTNQAVSRGTGEGNAVSNSSTVINSTIIDNRISAGENSVVIAPGADVSISIK